MTRLKAVPDTGSRISRGGARDLVPFRLEGVGDARVRLAAVVPDHRQAGECVGVKPSIAASSSAPGRGGRSVPAAARRSGRSSAGLALDGAVEQAVGVGLLGVEPGDEIGSCRRGRGRRSGMFDGMGAVLRGWKGAHDSSAGRRTGDFRFFCHFWRLCALPDGTERALRATIETPAR